MTDLLVGALWGSMIAFLAFRVYRHFFNDATTYAYPRKVLNYIPLVFIITLCILATPWRLIYQKTKKQTFANLFDLHTTYLITFNFI